MICLGAYVLGEFGYLLADKEVNPVSGLEQFNVIHAHFSKQLMPLTQALMLSSYVKMVSLHDDDVRNTILPIFKEMGGHIDMEVQQRAVEYHSAAHDILNQLPQRPGLDVLRELTDIQLKRMV